MKVDLLLTRVEAIVARADSIDALSRDAMAVVAEAIPADRRTLFVLDTANMSLRSALADGLGREIIVPLRIGVIGSAILRRRPMRVGDAYQHPFFSPDIDTSLGFRTRSLLVAPLLSRTTGRALGGIEMLNKIGGDFTVDDANQLVEAAARLARWIEDGTLYAAGVEADCIAMRNTLHCERASVFALEQRTSRLVALYADGDDGRVLSLNMRLGIAGLVAITSLPVLLDDAWSDTRFDRSVDTRTGYRTRSMLSVATREASGHANGVIQLINATGGRFDAAQMALLEAVGERLAAGIARLAVPSEPVEQ